MGRRHRRTRRNVIGAAALVLPPTCLGANELPVWSATFVAPGPSGGTDKLVEFDLDGEGPNPPRVVAFGGFRGYPRSAPGHFAVFFDGNEWVPLPGSVHTGGLIFDAIVFDADGEGPASPELVVATDITLPGYSDPSGVIRWASDHWEPLGGGIKLSTEPDDARAVSLAIFDGDVGAPDSARLIVSGRFDLAGNSPVGGLASWDGAQWASLPRPPVGPSETLDAMIEFDADGSGPGDPVLVLSAQSTVWALSDGAWTQLGGTFQGGLADEAPSTFAVLHDGLEPPALIGGGLFDDGAGDLTTILRWDGAEWVVFPGEAPWGVSAFSVSDLLVMDLTDDPGPELIAAGGFTRPGAGVAVWDGQVWASIGDLNGSVRSLLAIADTAHDGPSLVAGGFFDTAGSLPASTVAQWRAGAWEGLGPGEGLNAPVAALTVVDLDGAGQRKPELVAVGEFSGAGPHVVGGIGSWNGQEWAPLASPLPFGTRVDRIGVLDSFDFDGAGPLPPSVIVGGDFRVTVDADAFLGLGVLRDGEWTPLGFEGEVTSVVTHDPDGSGPAPPALYVGGLNIHSPAGDHSLVRWNGAGWDAIGDLRSIQALASFDPDADGPIPPQLIASGRGFVGGPQTADRNIGAWDGAQWVPLDERLILNSAPALLPIPAGELGFAGPVLLAIGEFVEPEANLAAVWDGQSWSALSLGDSGFEVNVSRPTEGVLFDPDGAGPLPSDLVIVADDIALRFSGDVWEPLVSRFNNPSRRGDALCLQPFDADGSGPAVPGLYVGGDFASLGASIRSDNLARFAVEPGLRVTRHSVSHTVEAGERIELSVADAPAPGVDYEWYDDHVNVIEGAASPTLVINPTTTDGGTYFAVLRRSGELFVCPPTVLEVVCPADITHDGNVDVADFAILMQHFGVVPLPHGGKAVDFNDNGIVDVFDFAFLVARFGIDCDG